MNNLLENPLLIMLPVLAAVGGMLAFASMAHVGSRHYAMSASLSISLLITFVALFVRGGEPVYIEGMVLYISISTVAAQIVAAPLLDRTRLIALVAGPLIAGYILTDLILYDLPMPMPSLPREGWFLCTVIAACIVGLAASAWMPVHPARTMVQEQIRAPQFSYVRDAGLLMIAAALVVLALRNAELPLTPVFAVSAITAALWPLLVGRGAARIHRAAEGILAGSIIALMSRGSGIEGVAYGILAAVLIQRGELIAAALRLDDPARLVGTLLLPAMAGMLLPLAHDLSFLADALRFLGATLLISGAVSLLWLVAMATVGLAANPARVREGLDFL